MKTSRSRLHRLNFAGLAIASGWSLQANACSFSINRSVTFEPGVSSILNQDRVAIAKTLIDANNSVARTGKIVIYGLADSNAKDLRKARAITETRVGSVMSYLRSLGVSQDRFDVDYHGGTFAQDAPPSERYQVLVTFIPPSSPCG
jgi:outer membrane protein OmpA-like peptidoglycan-associated protein